MLHIFKCFAFCLIITMPGFLTAGVTDPVDLWTDEDIIELNAFISSSLLTIQVRERNSLDDFSMHFIDIFLNSDQDANTGDARVGAVAGCDYRLSCQTGMIESFYLCELPTVDGDDELWTDINDITGASVQVAGNLLTINLPKNCLRNANAVDLFALAHVGNNPYGITGNGDRCPEYGTLNTSSGNVIVRRSARIIDRTFTDAIGDNPNGQDLTSARFNTFGDQMQMTLTFAAPVNPLDMYYDLFGIITIDSDRSLMTGFDGMGAAIPTWGGDVALIFTICYLAPMVELSFGQVSYNHVVFGPPSSDGRWRTQGNQLIMTCSVSAFDARFLTVVNGQRQVERRPGNGELITTVMASEILYSGGDDFMPEPGRAYDLATGQVLAPYVWDSAQTISATDPEDFGGVAGMDLIRVDAEVTDTCLVVKGVMSKWDNTEVDNMFEILLDTDMNTNTGTIVENNLTPAKPAIGADYDIVITSKDLYSSVGYFLDLLRPDGVIEPHDAWLFPVTSATGPASFTVTVPLKAIGNPTNLRLYVSTANVYVFKEYGTRYDIAPPEPMIVPVSETQVILSVIAGWNIVSVPLVAADMTVHTLFPDAVSSAFGYNNGYVATTTLTNGKGYWLKFDNPYSYKISGSVSSSKEIPVSAGWNIIGPFETNVQVADITSRPGGIIASRFFGYDNGYTTDATLIAGKGYWIKTNQAGTIVIPSAKLFY